MIILSTAQHNLIHSPVKLMGLFLSQGVAESHILNVQWDTHLSLLKGFKRREGKAMVRGTQVWSSCVITQYQSQKLSACGNPSEGGRRGAEGCSNAVVPHGWFSRASLQEGTFCFATCWNPVHSTTGCLVMKGASVLPRIIPLLKNWSHTTSTSESPNLEHLQLPQIDY